MGLFESIRTPQNQNQNDVNKGQPVSSNTGDEHNQNENRFNGNRYKIVPMFQSKREGIFWLMLSLNMGGADLSASDLVDEATRQADELEARNLAVWYRKRVYNKDRDTKDAPDSRNTTDHNSFPQKA